MGQNIYPKEVFAFFQQITLKVFLFQKIFCFSFQKRGLSTPNPSLAPKNSFFRQTRREARNPPSI
ncbi:hypothetical protein BKH46_05455 [Helicobacter sp. 12S02634-8]|nr:hypothetical protein BKH46_05455 [Helicobacter sp. 12S02634-8]